MRVDIVKGWASPRGLIFAEKQLEQMDRFQERLLYWNTKINLTAITDETDIAVKHWIDSLTVLPWIPPNAQLIDIGAGAGFPGVPLAVVRTDLTVTLLDSLRKRILFLQGAAEELGLSNVTCIHARAEELSRKPEYSGCYDVCTARAVARLDKLAGYALPFVKPNGLFLAMKGPDVTDEWEQAKPVMAKYGGELVEVAKVSIAQDITHSIVVIKKRP